MPDITELQQDRNAALRRAQKVVEEAREERGDGPADDSVSLTAEERDTFDDWMDEFSSYEEKISDAKADRNRLERLEEEREKLDERAREPVARGAFDDEEPEGDTGDEWGEWRNAFTRYLRGGESNLRPQDVKRLSNPPGETRESDVVVGTSNTGGVFVPTEVEDRFYDELKDFGGILEAVDAAPGDPIPFPMVTESGNPIDVVLSDDTANTAGHVNEGSTISSVSDISLESRTFHDQVYQSGPLAITVEAMDDWIIDPENYVRGRIQERIARAWAQDLIESTNVTSSTGVQGLITASTGAVEIANGSSNLGFSDLQALKFNVDPAHRARDRRWLMTNDSLLVVNQLTDGNGRPLLQPDLQQGSEGITLLGDPIHVDNSSTEIEFGAGSSGAKPIWYGNFGRFGVRRVRGLQIQTLSEKFALQRKIGFIGFVRVDARVMATTDLAAAQRPIRCLKETT